MRTDRTSYIRAVLLACLVAAGANAQTFVKDSEHLARIEQALPAEAPAETAKPRRLLIFTLNVGYGGHPSMAYANEAFTRMGRKTGSFDTVVTNDPNVFERESLKRFDAVFFNNTVGNCFTNASLRRKLQEFVTGGGGLMGVHGTTVAFTHWPGAIEDWPEFGFMIGARGANHKASDERVWVKLDDAEHPLNAPWPAAGFEYRDEFFRVHEPYSRDRLRVLWTIDTSRTDVNAGKPLGNTFRSDNDYALAWVRNYGRGRVFYCTVAHNPYVFWDASMLKFYLGAIQFVMGDLDAPTTPSAKLSPSVRAQEKLGWKLGIEAYTFHKFTFFETIERTRKLGLPYVGGLSFQPVSKDLPKNLEPQLSDEDLQKIRLKLESAGVRMLTYYIHDLPADETACRKIFEFGRKMGIETFMSEPKPEALDTVEKLSEEYGINVALHNHDQKASPAYWHPENITRLCKGRSKRLGACGDVGYWIRAGVDPVKAVETLGERLLTLQLHDLNSTSPDAHDVPWGTGVARVSEILKALKRTSAKPTMIGLEYSYDWFDSEPEIAQSIEYFNRTTVELSR